MNSIVLSVWGLALAVYGGFWLWYVGIPRPLTAAEIDAHLALVAKSDMTFEPGQLERLRAFLEHDDGGEFFMVNLIRLVDGPVTAPGGGEPKGAREVVEGYSKHFMPALFRRAGHPAFMGRAAGGYLEQWGVAPDPGWTAGAVIRYRSRRDMIELVTDPRFANAHAFKRAGMSNTFAFPTTPGFVVVGPKLWVALALALIAALAQIGIGALRS